MIIKVCGIKYLDNLHSVSALPIHMLGLNFYSPSVRYMKNHLRKDQLKAIPPSIQKVGVFVNHSISEVLSIKDEFLLDAVQLHGDEDIDFGFKISSEIPVIKVFRISEHFNFSVIEDHDYAQCFLFDSATHSFGGSGKKFEWSQLTQYKGTKPFLLSGGIGPNDINKLHAFNHPQFKGIDINSQFESKPAYKDIKSLSKFIHLINQH